jgi:serine protease
LRALAPALVLFATLAAGPATAGAARVYVPGEVIVGYTRTASPDAQATAARVAAARPGADTGTQRVRVLHVAPGHVRATIARLRRQPGVAFAAPNPIAHASAVAAAPALLPNDPGIPGFPSGLAALQWNFYGPAGVGALQAWGNVAAAGRPGGRGVRIAVLDTGVAYRRLRGVAASPDFAGTRFVAGYDFVAGTRFPLDRNREGHGTHVAGTIAETTGNGIRVSGLAWGATIIPVRVLDAHGYGDAATIAKGIRYAARHGARVINMSLEFPMNVRETEIPDIVSAIRAAHRRGAVIVASSGNEGRGSVAYPARTKSVISVGATTSDGCLASFSNDGAGLGLVAPGGGDDAQLAGDPSCHPGAPGTDIYQETYAQPGVFGLPAGYAGTSMAAPHVSATAALVIASGVLGPDPTADEVTCRVEATARTLGLVGPNRVYGHGLVDAAAATSPLVLTPQCLTPR